MKYDYLIIGSGLFGSTFARLAAEPGKTCLVVEQRDHFGGNVHSENIEGVEVHTYGPHIFHTNDEDIWQWVNKFSEFVPYVYSPKAFYGDRLYSLPFNLNTFYEMWGTSTPQKAYDYLISTIVPNDNPQNLEEQAISLVGTEVYEKLIKHYTMKQWQKDPKDLPASIIKRLPVRMTFDNNYFNDKYQGIPRHGYTEFMRNILDHENIDVALNTKFNKEDWDDIADKIVYTGKIDEYFNYCHGELEYRTLRFETEVLDIDNYQGVAVINDCTPDNPWTRTIEHRHFDKYCRSLKTVITRETPDIWSRNKIPYYPINDNHNTQMFKQYEILALKEQNVIFGGRLSEYRYYDMHQVIGSAMAKWEKENERI